MAANDTLGLNQVFQIYHEDESAYEGLVMHKSATDSVVMSLGDSISGEAYWPDNELELSMHEYITYNGVKYVLVNPPTIVREGMVADNSELKGMTKYSFKFYHPMYQLGNLPFSDVAVTNDQKKYLSENKTFSWIGTANDFLAKLNKNLEDTQWMVVMSDRFPEAKKTEMSDVIAFDKNTVADALKTAYETWGVPYVIDVTTGNETGYTSIKHFKVVWGLPSNEIYESAAKKQEDTPYVFQMGKGVGLKNNSRTPRNNKIITRIAGYGSENNIPYGYPQIVWTGNQAWDYTINNDPSATNSYPIYDGIVGGRKVRLIKHPFTRTHLMPNVYVDAVNKKVNPNATGYDPDTELKDYYDATEADDYPNPINLQAPSYDIHEFEDIKPELGNETIVGVTPLNPDLTPASEWDDTMDDDGNYLQSYFEITLPTLSFDIYACAAITEAMQINMRSGACLGCTFPVEVDWEDYKANFYNDDGEFDPVIHTQENDGHVRNGKKYPNSTTTSVKLILKKEIETFGTLMPNTYQHPASGDQFVVLGISLPTSYITNAQTRLDNAMKSYMLENNVYYYDYPLKFDEAFLRNNTYILEQLKPNAIVRFEFAGQQLQLFVKQMNVKFGDGVLPKYDITLTDNVDVVLNQIGQVSDDVEKLATLISLLRQSYSNNVWVELAKKLSKTDDDTAQGFIRFVKGLQVGESFESGLLGHGGVFRKDDDGKTYIEADKLYIRMRAYFDSVEIRRYMHSGGNRVATPAGVKCVRVDNIAKYNDEFVVVDENGTYWEEDINGDKHVVASGLTIIRYRCYFRAKDNDGNEITNDFVIGDQAYCHITNGGTYSLQMHHYWRLVVGCSTYGTMTEDGEHWIDLANYFDANNQPAMLYWTNTMGEQVSHKSHQVGSDIPVAQDDIVQLGNADDTYRQGAIIEYSSGEDSPSYKIYQNIDDFDLNDKNYISLGYSSQTGRAYMNVYGDMFIGAKPDPVTGESPTYIKYEQEDSETGLPKMTIKAVVEFQNPDDPTQTTTLEDFASAVVGDIENLQSQIDGEIDTWFYAGIPTLQNAPANEWTTDAEKEKHTGDLYYDIGTGADAGKAYRFIRSQTTPYVYSWQYIDDTAITEALRIAAHAQDTADGKRRVFTAQPYPPYDVGDLWSNAIYPANNTEKDAENDKYYKDLLTCKTAKAEGGSFSISDWGLTTNYTDDTALTNFVSNTYAPFVTNIQGQVDKKAETWYQDSDPSGSWNTTEKKESHVGDIWYDTSQNGGHKTYIWQDFGSSANPRYAWAEADVPDDVFDKIDGKADIFVSKPTTYNINDMWIIESNLSSTDMPTGCQAGDIVISSASRTNSYNKNDWAKKDRYTDDTKFNTYISQIINGTSDQSDSAVVAQALHAIKAALNENTTISGGLILTSLISLKSNSQVWAGISGLYDANETGGGIAAWYGGGRVDHEAYPSSSDYAKSLFRFDGSGYVAGGNITWNANGAVTIKNITTLSDSQNTNLLNELATFNSAFTFTTSGSGSTTVLSITPNVPFTALTILDTSVSPNVGRPVATQKWVEDNFMTIAAFETLFNAINSSGNKVNHPYSSAVASIKAMFGLWTDQYLSAKGLNSSGGSGGATTLAGLVDTNITSPQNGQALIYNSTQGKWINGSIASGTVTAVSVNGTQYSPLSGIVTLPAYPSKTSWNYDDRYLKLTGGTLTASSGNNTALTIKSGSAHPNIMFMDSNDTILGYIGVNSSSTPYFHNGTTSYQFLLSGTTLDSIGDGKTRKLSDYAKATRVTTLEGYFTNGIANEAAKLSTVSQTLFGNTYWTSGGVPTSIGTSSNHANLNYVDNITMYGVLSFLNSDNYDFTMFWDVLNGRSVFNMYSFEVTYHDICFGLHVTNVSNGALYFDTSTYKWGIGTALPTYKLDVNGNIRATSTSLFPAIILSGDGSNNVPYIDFFLGGIVDGKNYSTRIVESSSGVLSLRAKNSSNATTIVGLTVGEGLNGDYIQIGAIRIVYDSTNNALKVIKNDGNAANFYATGAVSALGANTSSGGGGGSLYLLTDVKPNSDASPSRVYGLAGTSADDGKVLTYSTSYGKWIASALNAGTVTQVNVGSTAYAPQNGIVSLPAYPTKESWNYDNRYLKLTGGILTTSSGNNTPLWIKSGSTSPNILFEDSNDNILGYIGVSPSKNPYFHNGTSAFTIWHSGNLTPSNYASASSVSTLQGYFTNGVANEAAKLSDTSTYTAWGQTFFTGGQPVTVTGDITVGNGNIYLNNNKYVYWKDSGGTSRAAIFLSDSNNFRLGYGTASAGYDTIISGNNVKLTYGTSRTDGIILNNSGNVGIGVAIPSYKLSVGGDVSATNFRGDLIGNADTATTASKLSTVSQTLWGNTYWTSGGVPTSIGTSSNHANLNYVGSIQMYDGLFIIDSHNYDMDMFWDVLNGKSVFNMYSFEVTYHDLCIGFHCSGASNGALYFDASTFRWGIGTSSPAQKLDVNGNIKTATSDGAFIQIGGARIVWDNTNKALKVIQSDNSTAANFYATGAVSAWGANTSGGTVTFGFSLSGTTLSTGSNTSVNLANSFVSLSGSQTVTGKKTFNGGIDVGNDMAIAGSITPSTTGQYSIGTSSKKFSNVFANAITVSGNATISGTVTMCSSNVVFSYTAASQSQTDRVTLNTNGKTFLLDTGMATPYYTKNWQSWSDMRKKNVVHNVGMSVNQVADSPIFAFRWRGQDDNSVSIGTSAQYWQNVLPEVVTTAPDGFLAMDYTATALAAAIITARTVQSHEQRIAQLEYENEKLRNEIEMLKAA